MSKLSALAVHAHALIAFTENVESDYPETEWEELTMDPHEETHEGAPYRMISDSLMARESSSLPGMYVIAHPGDQQRVEEITKVEMKLKYNVNMPADPSGE